MRASRKRLCDATTDVPAAPTAHVDDLTAVDAPLALRRYILTLWVGSELDNKLVTTLCYFITSAGGAGVADLGLDPALKGRNHARKLKEVLPTAVLGNMVIARGVPYYNSKTSTRDHCDFMIRSPLEAIASDYKRYPADYDANNFDTDDWDVPIIMGHPLIAEHGIHAVVPLGLYTDKIAYTKKDTFLRYSVGVAWKRETQTIWTIQSRAMCKCGCNGRCTLDVLTIETNRLLNELQDRPTDADRPWCAVTEHRGDWPEKASIASLKSHAALKPCIDCDCNMHNMHSGYAACTLNHLPWRETTHQDYIDELHRHLYSVEITTEDVRAELVSHTLYRCKHPWGRYIEKCTPRLKRMGLKNGYRVVAHAGTIGDIHSIDTLALPLTVYFYRQDKQSVTAGVSLLWDVPEAHFNRI